MPQILKYYFFLDNFDTDALLLLTFFESFLNLLLLLLLLLLPLLDDEADFFLGLTSGTGSFDDFMVVNSLIIFFFKGAFTECSAEGPFDSFSIVLVEDLLDVWDSAVVRATEGAAFVTLALTVRAAGEEAATGAGVAGLAVMIGSALAG